MMEWLISSSVLIVVVIALRYLLRGKISLRLQYALWLLVALRLLIPFSFGGTGISVINAAESVPVVQDYQSVRQVDSIWQAEDGAVEGYPAFELTPDAPLLVAEHKTEAEFARLERMINWRHVFNHRWLGVIALALYLISVNQRFAARLVKTRRLFTCAEPLMCHSTDKSVHHIPFGDNSGRREPPQAAKNLSFVKDKILRRFAPQNDRGVAQNDKGEGCPLPVYVSDLVETPCLFGLFKPAIYLTSQAAADEITRSHAIAHELTHYRHGDHIWALLRCACLCLHWYNPLVWWAAALSMRDSELACDQGTIRRLGEDQRQEYGHTLIDLTCAKPGPASLLRTATTMLGSRRSIKERVRLIAKKPRMAVYTLIAVIIIASLAAACTFIGAEQEDSVRKWAAHLAAEDITYAQASQDYGFEQIAHVLSEAEMGQLATLFNQMDAYDFSLLDGRGHGVYQLFFANDADESEFICHCTAEGGIFMGFDSRTAARFGAEGKTWWIDSPELYAFIQDLIAAGEVIPAQWDTFAIVSSGEAVEPYLDMLSEQTWTGEGWLYADGFPMNGERLAELRPELPQVIMDRYFTLLYPENGGMLGSLEIYDLDFNLVSNENDYGLTALWWLPQGEYMCMMTVFQKGDYIAAEETYESSRYRLMFRLMVDESYGAVPFAPEDIHDLTHAELRFSFGTFTLAGPRSLERLAELLSSAQELEYGAGCPFNAPLFLTRADGTVGVVCPAEDSCGVYLSDGVFYKYQGDNEKLWDLFGVMPYFEQEEYDEAGRVSRRTEYTWYQPGPYTEYSYNQSGLLETETRYDWDGELSAAITYEYDANGYLIKESETTPTNPGPRVALYENDERGNCVRSDHYYYDGAYRGSYVMAYNGLDQCTRREYHSPDSDYVGVEEYEYDQRGNKTKVTTLAAPDDALLHWDEYVYDENDRQVSWRRFEAGGAQLAHEEYAYDDKGRRTEIRYYDAAGNLVGTEY